MTEHQALAERGLPATPAASTEDSRPARSRESPEANRNGVEVLRGGLRFGCHHGHPGAAVDAFEAAFEQDSKTCGQTIAAEKAPRLTVGQAATAGEKGAEAKRTTARCEHEELPNPQKDPNAGGHQSGVNQVHPENGRTPDHEGNGEDTQKPLEEEKCSRRSDGDQASAVGESGHRAKLAWGEFPSGPLYSNRLTTLRACGLQKSPTDSCNICTRFPAPGEGRLGDRGTIGHPPQAVARIEPVPGDRLPASPRPDVTFA